MRYGTKGSSLLVSCIQSLLLLFIPMLTIVALNASTETRQNRIRQELSGTWQLNPELTANGRSQLPGNLDSPNPGSLIRLTDLWSYVESEPLVAELLEATELLQILGHGKEITMNAVGSPDIVVTRTIYTDGRLSEQRFGSGNLAVSHARWDDERLIIESVTTRALHVTETYELTADENSLVVWVQIEKSQWDQSLFIHRVYNRVP